MKLIQTLTLAIAFVFCANCLDAQNFDKAKIDSLFTIIENADKGMGSVSLFKDGKEIYSHTYGFADVEQKKKADSSTKYRIGSITKSFTAAIILKLQEEGKLSLTRKLSDFYPKVINADLISIEDMLRHQSGIFNITNEENYLEWNTKPMSKQQLLDKIIADGSTFKPGARFEYSNSNYILLTFIAEDVTGETFAALLDKYIIKVCGLKNTCWGEKINASQNEAYSYSKFDTWKKESESDMSIPLGAGAIVSTPYDLNLFYNSLFEGKIINNKSLELMTVVKNNFGLGLFQVPFYELKGFGHNGGIDGFLSNAYYFPSEKLGIAITSNSGISFPLNDIIVGVLSIYSNKDYELPKITSSETITSEELDRLLGIYSSPMLPLKLTFTKDGVTLIAQGTGQPSFPLEYAGNNIFKSDAVKVKFHFFPDENRIEMEQMGQKFEFKKEK